MFRNVSRLIAMLCALSVFVAGTFVTSTTAAAQPNPRNAQPLIRQLARAVGGESRLDQIDNFTIVADGTTWTLDEGLTPGEGATQPGPYSTVAVHDVAGDRVRIDTEIVSFGFIPRELTEIADADAGYLIGQNSNFGPPVETAMLSDRWASTRLHQMLLNPQVLVKALLDGELTARRIGPVNVGGTAHDLLVVSRDGAPSLRVFADANSHLITRIDTVENDALRRDVQLRVHYKKWRLAGDGLKVPMRVKVFYDRELIQEETRRAVEVNTDLDGSLFDPPDGATPVFDAHLTQRGVLSHQHLQSFAALGFPLDGLQLDVTATELSPGVHWIAGGSHHSMVIEQDDGLVLVDAPQNRYRAEALLAYIAANFPGKPLSYVAQSHHHADHSAGIRTIVAAGAALAVHESAATFWSKIVTAPSTVVPDALALNPVDVEIVSVPDGGSTTLGSGDNAVEIHSFDQPHAEDLVLIVSGGVAFIVDLFSPFPGAPLPPEGEFILDVINERGLEVHTIAGGHGGFIVLDS